MTPERVDESPGGNYLNRLTRVLLRGAAELPAATRDRHRRFLLASQNPDGGFSGRAAGSDLYYTAFALRSLVVLQHLDASRAGRAAEFLRASMGQPASAIDLFSFVVACGLVALVGGPDVTADAPADWRDRVRDALEARRTPDGGYAQTPGGAAGSTYHTFLIALTYESLGMTVPEMGRAAAFARSRRREDGGFVEVAPARKSGANPTAAGVGLLQVAGELDADTASGAADCLLALRADLDGGFRANGRIPASDLLSTFTAVWTLTQLGAAERIDAESARGFARALEARDGGFHAGLWDEGLDVEYTFYGLGTLCALPADPRGSP